MRYESNAVAEIAAASTFDVKDLRNHSPETIATLRGLLAGRADARPDRKRPHFYEIDGETCVFYVYVSPVDSSVELLATWPRTESVGTQPLCH
jgi:hypothetical protein